MIERLQTAKGHVAKIIPFDDATVLLPLKTDEARRLLAALDGVIKRLKETNDFPEQAEYEMLRDNLFTAYWMLSEK